MKERINNSRCMREAEQQERERLRAKSPMQRMEMALRAGRIATELAKLRKNAAHR